MPAQRIRAIGEAAVIGNGRLIKGYAFYQRSQIGNYLYQFLKKINGQNWQ